MVLLMWETRLLERAGDPIEVYLDYVDSSRERKYIPVKINSLKQGLTSGTEPQPRCWLQIIDLSAHKAKTLVSSRILAVCDRQTGEVFAEGDDALDWIADRMKSEKPPFWPSERLYTLDVGVEFDKDGYAKDWAFGVLSAFRGALDIVRVDVKEKRIDPESGEEYSKTVERWARGLPPLYSFSARDNFKFPPLRGAIKNAKWKDQLKVLTCTVTVIDAQPDTLVSKKLSPGYVVAEIIHYKDGVIDRTDVFPKMSQAEFSEYLRVGPG